MTPRALASCARDVARARGGGAFAPAQRAAAERIVASVRRRGDAAVLASVRRFDRPAAQAGDLVADGDALRRAARGCPPALRDALDASYRRIRAFHARQRPRPLLRRDGSGEVALQPTALGRVGALVPRGAVAYPSTVLMTGIPAQVAGVRELVVASPMPADGALDAALAYAAILVGARTLYRAGGAAAVAALAYGTALLPRVDKIVGPGNAYVTAAKWLVAADVGVDGFQGPSELVIVASGDVAPSDLALDLLAQAEHGSGAFAALLSDDGALLEAVGRELRRRDARRVALYRAASVARAVDAANEAAPEHVLLAGRAAARLASRVTRAGALFVGASSAVAFGDYVAGSNHCLPTGGTARWASALRVEDFVRWTTRVEMRGHLGGLVRRAAVVARYEGMRQHAASLEARLS